MAPNWALTIAGAQTEEGVIRFIGISTAGVLFALGLVHVYWAGGGGWGTDVTIPQQDGKPLFQPPPTGTLLVAVLLFSAGLVVLGRLALWGTALPRWPFVAGTWTLAAVFLGRIVGDFRWFGLFKRMRGTAFAWWDTWLFVPLCLLLALGAWLRP
jgi:Protein of unknown function (DUF3995)